MVIRFAWNKLIFNDTEAKLFSTFTNHLEKIKEKIKW